MGMKHNQALVYEGKGSGNPNNRPDPLKPSVKKTDESELPWLVQFVHGVQKHIAAAQYATEQNQEQFSKVGNDLSTMGTEIGNVVGNLTQGDFGSSVWSAGTAISSAAKSVYHAAESIGKWFESFSNYMKGEPQDGQTTKEA